MLKKISVKNFSEAEKYLLTYVPQSRDVTYPGEIGRKRTVYLLSLLGNPQEKIKVIHIAGTSGKGSTAYFTSLLLYAHGFKTGLHLSPHLVNIRERFQINNRMISEKEFVYYLSEIIPVIEKAAGSKFGKPTYFEILVCLAFYIFCDKKIDYAVIETGLGGLYDATNVVKNSQKLAVITRIGFDHMQILGNTISEIAYQKASIIQENNFVISVSQEPSAEKVINKIANERHAEISYISEGLNWKNISLSPRGISFDFKFESQKVMPVKLAMKGLYQAENVSLALASVYALAKRDGFAVKGNSIRRALSSAYFAGRMDIFKVAGKTVVADGAHNVQKMDVFLRSLKVLYPKRKFHFLVAFKKGKDVSGMLEKIIPLAEHITVSRFFTDNQDLIQLSEKPQDIVRLFKKSDYKDYTIQAIPEKAYEFSLKNTEDILIITGSLYFLGKLYPYFPSVKMRK